MTSEFLLGISEPVDHQCKNIDDMIKRADEALLFASQAMLAIDYQTVSQANKEVVLRLTGYQVELEELRNAIEGVRSWGADWKKIGKALLASYEPKRLNPDPINDGLPF